MLLDDMVDLLTSGGIVADGTKLLAGYMEEAPDLHMAVYETGGQGPLRAFRSSPGQPVVEQPRVQVVMRCVPYDYHAARLKLNDVYRLLEGFGDRSINGVRYLWVGAVQSPFPMGRDAAGRVKLAVNFDVVKELSTA